MFTKVRSHLTYANVMVTAVMFIALGGVALAVTIAPRNSVNSRSVVNESLRGKDVRANTLKGADIDESSLANPNQVFFSERLPGSDAAPPVVLGSLGGVTLEAKCVTTAGAPSVLFSLPDGFAIQGSPLVPLALVPGPVVEAEANGMPGTSQSTIYEHEFRGDDGTLVSATVAITTLNAEVGTDCVFYGSMSKGRA